MGRKSSAMEDDQGSGTRTCKTGVLVKCHTARVISLTGLCVLPNSYVLGSLMRSTSMSGESTKNVCCMYAFRHETKKRPEHPLRQRKVFSVTVVSMRTHIPLLEPGRCHPFHPQFLSLVPQVQHLGLLVSIESVLLGMTLDSITRKTNVMHGE